MCVVDAVSGGSSADLRSPRKEKSAMKRAVVSTILLLVVAAAGSIPEVAAQTVPPLVFVQPMAPAAIRSVQDQLRRTGAYSGRVDGIWGADSQAALENFQRNHGLQPTGELNQPTVASLGLSASDLLAASQLTPTPPPGNVSPSVVRAVQSRLRALNFYRGEEDGIWGGSTQAALERFQQGQGLQASGQLNPATITALGLDPNLLVGPR
jgi:peptidoglycan hydrolase-like protein with peptidoglycan-binding domain